MTLVTLNIDFINSTTIGWISMESGIAIFGEDELKSLWQSPDSNKGQSISCEMCV